MRPIPGTITDPRVTPLIDRDPGDEQTFSGPKLTVEQWATLVNLLGELPTILGDWLTHDEHAVLQALKSSRV